MCVCVMLLAFVFKLWQHSQIDPDVYPKSRTGWIFFLCFRCKIVAAHDIEDILEEAACRALPHLPSSLEA